MVYVHGCIELWKRASLKQTKIALRRSGMMVC